MASIIGILIRHLLSGVGGAIVAEGFASGDQVQAITGGAAALIAVGASWWQKWKAKNNG